ncbi:maternal embryonic leucine zipper kinase-like [Watersipora subatra]|uniref:maternal embryonic leucine zipper kinase-like n=1 Tax=Watersipora subatra TaxID=2589382 RepID=UPI00355C7A51
MDTDDCLTSHLSGQESRVARDRKLGMPYNNSSVSPVPAETPANAVKSTSGNSLSQSLDSSSERKRRIAMPNRSSRSTSDTNIPATKIGKSAGGNGVTDSNMQAHSSSDRGDSATGFVLLGCEAPLCGRIKPLNVRKNHECTAIIRDPFNEDAKAIVCRVKCPLGDPLAHRYPSIPQANKTIVSTGRNCLDVSTKDLAVQGIRCIEHLYKGLYSNIFVGYREASHQYVAVKLTNIGNHCCKRELRTISPCFEAKHNSDEIKYLTQMNHPNIISILGQFETKSSKNAILLEFCPNGRLSGILDKTMLMTEAVASRFFHQMFAAVKYIHTQGYAVRNIALQHFLLSESNEVKLIDLSQTCPFHESRYDPSIGVPGFQAPETLNPHGEIILHKRADIWSLGACLYSMLTGELTDASHSRASSYKDAFFYQNHLRQLLSSSVLELTAGMLEFLPQYRFSTVRVEYSEWYNQVFNAPITGSYLLRHTYKAKLCREELESRGCMEL